jgi:hypothetical protein
LANGLFYIHNIPYTLTQVAELKLELKKRNLTVSGTKTTLLERYFHQAILRNSNLIILSHRAMDEIKKTVSFVPNNYICLFFCTRLRPILEGIIAAGRQQFQQPYKQISIPPKGACLFRFRLWKIFASGPDPVPEPDPDHM